MEFTPLALRLHLEARQQIEGDLPYLGQMNRCGLRDDAWLCFPAGGSLCRFTTIIDIIHSS